MVDIMRVDREAFREVWDEILSIMESMESDKASLKQLKSELGSIIGADSAKETSALIKALLKKKKDSEFYDEEAVASAQEFWDEIIENWRTPREEQ